MPMPGRDLHRDSTTVSCEGTPRHLTHNRVLQLARDSCQADLQHQMPNQT